MSISTKQREDLIKTLEKRFVQNLNRHKGVKLNAILAKLEKNPKKLESLFAMEETGGEPDVVLLGKKKELVFVDCAEESPKGRRSYCYDRAALNARKEHKPKNSAMDVAKEMGIELLSEDEYRALQELGEFDTKTSSWIQTPADIRKRGGALFCDRRYDNVFAYHNGAESYYAARGFRGLLRI